MHGQVLCFVLFLIWSQSGCILHSSVSFPGGACSFFKKRDRGAPLTGFFRKNGSDYRWWTRFRPRGSRGSWKKYSFFLLINSLKAPTWVQTCLKSPCTNKTRRYRNHKTDKRRCSLWPSNCRGRRWVTLTWLGMSSQLSSGGQLEEPSHVLTRLLGGW